MSYSKQEWVNNVSYIDKDKLDHIEDGIYQNSIDIESIEETLSNKNIITAGLSSNVTLSTTGETDLTLNSTKGRVGTKLSVSNGSVVIGSDITMVLISAAIYTNKQSGSGAACNVYIKKNGANVAQAITSGPTGEGNRTTVIPPVLLSVQSGDYITLGCYGYSGDLISASVGTNLTIQAVD